MVLHSKCRLVAVIELLWAVLPNNWGFSWVRRANQQHFKERIVFWFAWSLWYFPGARERTVHRLRLIYAEIVVWGCSSGKLAVMRRSERRIACRLFWDRRIDSFWWEHFMSNKIIITLGYLSKFFYFHKKMYWVWSLWWVLKKSQRVQWRAELHRWRGNSLESGITY